MYVRQVFSFFVLFLDPPGDLGKKAFAQLWVGAPGRFSLVWLWCGGHTEVRSVPRVFTERSEVPLVTLNLCVMRRYHLGEGDLVSTQCTFLFVYRF